MRPHALWMGAGSNHPRTRGMFHHKIQLSVRIALYTLEITFLSNKTSEPKPHQQNFSHSTTWFFLYFVTWVCVSKTRSMSHVYHFISGVQYVCLLHKSSCLFSPFTSVYFLRPDVRLLSHPHTKRRPNSKTQRVQLLYHPSRYQTHIH